MLVTTPQQEAAAQFLVAARKAQRPGERLPEDCRPANIESALVIQRRVGVLLGQDIGGWKCSAPTKDRPIAAAPIFTPTIAWTSPCELAATGSIVKIEPEVAFVMDRDLPQRAAPYSEAEILAATAEPRLALELLGTRYLDPESVSWPEMMADSIQNQGLFVGPILAGGLKAPLANFPITVQKQSGSPSTRHGRHADGHPLRPLYWLANFLATRGEGLRAGQVVTTGSYAGAIEVPLGQPLSVTFGNLGVIEVAFERSSSKFSRL